MIDELKKEVYEAARNVCLMAVSGFDAEIDNDNFEQIVDEQLIVVVDKAFIPLMEKIKEQEKLIENQEHLIELMEKANGQIA